METTTSPLEFGPIPAHTRHSMTIARIKSLTRTALLALALATAACSGSPPANEAPLAGADIGGPFTLVDQNGNSVSDSDFAGQYRIMYFGYSFCPDVCPLDLQKITQGFKLVEQNNPDLAARIQPIFVTVDPERDTPDVLKNYVSAFHPRLIGLTGTPEEIAKTAKEFLVVFHKQKDEGASDYLVDHSRQAYLLGPKGEPLALLPYDGTPRQVADTIEKWAQ